MLTLGVAIVDLKLRRNGGPLLCPIGYLVPEPHFGDFGCLFFHRFVAEETLVALLVKEQSIHRHRLSSLTLW